MSTAVLDQAPEAIDSINETSALESAASSRAALEVQNSSIAEYKSSISMMEQSGKTSRSFLPSLDISFDCVRELTEAGMAARDLLGVGIPVCELLAAGFNSLDLLSGGASIADLIMAGVSPSVLGLAA